MKRRLIMLPFRLIQSIAREGAAPAHYVRCALKARWIPACAGMTKFKTKPRYKSSHSRCFSISYMFKKPRRPREGGDPAHFVRCALKARLDSRLPGGITKFKMEIAVTCG